MFVKQSTILFIFFLLLGGCISQKKAKYKDQPPKFFGKIIENTTARYNAFYNANYIYEQSLIASEDGFQENFSETLPVSIPDALAKSGNLGGDMETIKQKTARVIDRRPYSKWVDDNYLLNGIAHYVEGEYSKAEEIFIYTSSEYKEGVNYERIGARQRIKGANIAKQRREEAEKKLKEREEEIKKREEERKEKIKENKKKIKQTKKKKVLSRKEQYKAKQKAKKEGKDLTTKEVLESIRKEQNNRDRRDEKISEDDIELLNKAATAINDNADNPGFLKHPLAAKDAMLWLAKTYITQEKFIAANAVLTAINEDETFPNRLNEAYYLTYADMYIRLNNLPKAAEYIQLAITDTKRKDKGRLYYVLGQTYLENGQTGLALEAFNTVKKYHPYYDFIYHAEMNVLEKEFQAGKFTQEDYTKKLKAMSKDAKNLEFFSQVNYYLGQAYLAQNDNEQAIKAFNTSLQEPEFALFSHKHTHLALAQSYYKEQDYKEALHSYENTVAALTEEEPNQKKEAILYKEALTTIVNGFELIHKQDSLLVLGELPREEIEKIIEKKVDKELKALRKQKLDSLNQEYGSGISTTASANNNRRRNNNSSSSGEFYFYDIQQSVNGFSEFRQTWGDRPNVDGWRRQAFAARQNIAANTNRRNSPSASNDEKEATKNELFSTYLNEVPISSIDKKQSKEIIVESYLSIASAFIEKLGEYERGKAVLEDLAKRELTNKQRQEADEVWTLLHRMQANEIEKTKPTQYTQIGNEEETPNATPIDEIEQLYSQTYELYKTEKLDKAILLINQAESYQDNKYAANFAFLKAMCYQKSNPSRYLLLLTEFKTKFPDSALVPTVNELLAK